METEKEIEVKAEELKEEEILKKNTLKDEEYKALQQVTVKLNEANLKIGYLETEKFNLIIQHAKLKDMKEKLVSKVNKDFGFAEGSIWNVDPDTKEVVLTKKP